MNKKREVYFNLNNFLLATSFAFDFKENELHNVKLGHSKRVMYISLKLGEKLGLNAQDMSDLCSYSLIHNNALLQAPINTKEYCELSQNNISNFPFVQKKANILKYHLEYYNGTGIYNLSKNDIPLLSQILGFSVFLDRNFNLTSSLLQNKTNIKTYVKEQSNIRFSKNICEAFLDLSDNLGFYLDLQNENEILSYIFNTIQDFTKIISFEDLFKITSLFTKITQTNEIQEEIYNKVLEYYKFDYKDKYTFLIAASLINIGKLVIPNDILHKKSKLSSQEYEIIKSYPYYTKKILNNIMGFTNISLLASKVQETLDASGYPYKIPSSNLSFNDRLIATINIYIQLISTKPYRKAFLQAKSFEILQDLVKNNKLDESIVNDLQKIFF